MTVRDKQKEKRRQEILLAGLELFVKNGYAATKTSDIAKELNISDGLLFHYFATKETLYKALIQIGMDTSQNWMETTASDPLAFFTEVTQQILDMLKANPQGAKFFVLMAQALRSNATPESVLQILAPQNQRYTKIVELICRGQATGAIRSGEPGALAFAFWCSIQGMAEQLAVYPQTPFPQAEWFVSIVKNPKGAI